jgi:hypothetical protein
VRYFKDTKKWIELEHDPNSPPELHQQMHAAYLRRLHLYYRHLDSIATRLGKRAYRFFRFGWAETGLHDGYLLSFNMGDNVNLDHKKNWKLRFDRAGDRTKTVIEMHFLNYERTFLHSFKFHRLRKVEIDIPSGNPLWFKPGGTLGHIYTYEIVALTPKYLAIEWLLDSGGTIRIEFQKLLCRCERIEK